MDFGSLDGRDNSNSAAYHLDPSPKWFGSKPQETSHSQDEWRDLKVAKIAQDDFSKAMLLQQHRSTSSSHHSDSRNNMLSFSSPNTPQTLTLPYYAPNTTGYGSGGSVRGMIAGVRGPFTPSQWMELEHQALIYKYITVNAPIASNLLIPIRKALETAAFASYPGTHLRPATYVWGGFQLGLSNSSDPEPGRCRRTDGKKWRCSRDAVADQKYCDRHMNRGRHRSRKPVEGQTGHSVSNGPTTTTQLSSRLQTGTTPNPATFPHDNRSFLNKGNVGAEKIEDATIGLEEENPLSVSVPTPSEFGFVCSDSLLNPLHKKDGEIQKSQNSLGQFIDDSEKTQLSISIPIPMGSADLMSSTSSPISSERRLNNLSPLRMGARNGSWIPGCWESSMGGPLGEALHHNSRTNSPSALNLMADASWEISSRQQQQQMMSMSMSLSSSPTGVLQKTTFASVSNSSAGSSPRTTDHNLLITSSSLPFL